MMMILITEEIRAELLRNGALHLQAQRSESSHDPFPVVKLFTPDAQATWLLSELDPEDPDLAFGLCDLGLGFPEFGTVRISELEELRGPTGLPVERDLFFTPRHPISWYAAEAQMRRRIVTP